MKEASLEKEKTPCGTRDAHADALWQTTDRAVIEMAPEPSTPSSIRSATSRRRKSARDFAD